jgi:hypothetical protein
VDIAGDSSYLLGPSFRTYWDQASVLKQIGLLTDPRLPVFGAESARMVHARG